MGLSDADVQKQIKHMLAFIEQEASEKVEEIDAKAEEEFNIEKGKLVQQQRVKIMEYYEKKEKLVELQRKIQNSNLTSQSKLKILKAKESHMQHVLEEAHKQLSKIVQEKGKYRELLKLLIIESLFELLEPEVILQCKKSDAETIKGLLNECIQVYQKNAGQNITLEVNSSQFLPEDNLGGIMASNKSGKIKVANTFDSRLEQGYNQLIPEIKETLFGRNKNRKFYD
ncbi:unnamed protein product [Gordionus sp. m RMFG-2023]|uniref:V-type proton ATPase subunit E-like n=1 Tax=Gordionus sp. m RMFG-2023 TaxID=3053472 RepID=UPI0030E27135